MKLANIHDLHKDILSHHYEYIFLLDLSNFASINKEYGKHFSDKVLTSAGELLRVNITNSSKLYKIESDRFVILTKDEDIESIEQYCKQIISFFDTQYIVIDEVEVHVTFSIGVAHVLDDAITTIINSEYALESSKSIGSRNFHIYDEKSEYSIDEKDSLKWLKITREMILDDNIEPYYQPIKNILTGEITRYEVLARGVVNGNVINPEKFVKAAKKLGLLSSITKTIINKSFEYLKDSNCKFSINLTERDLHEKYLCDFLKDKLLLFDIDPSRIAFEILEDVVVKEHSNIVETQISKLKEMGFAIAVDDFGIEYSNFSRLLDMNVDIIKIDGTFIKDLKDNEKTRLIVQTIVNLAKSLGVQTIAEYVKDRYTYDTLEMFGIDYAQGYFIGKPKPTVNFE